jgi:hypothetical protein
MRKRSQQSPVRFFSGTRAGTAGSFVRRICEAAGVESATQDKLKEVFAQMTTITTMRDNVLHYGARSVAEGDGVVTSALRAHIPDRVVTFLISPSILNDMTSDLRQAIYLLLSRHVGRPGRWASPIRLSSIPRCINHGDISLCYCLSRQVTDRKGRMLPIAQNHIPSHHHLRTDDHVRIRLITPTHRANCQPFTLDLTIFPYSAL